LGPKAQKASLNSSEVTNLNSDRSFAARAASACRRQRNKATTWRKL
jgi:hypothetical protein